MSLRKEGFLAIVAVAHADGLVRKDEVDGLLNAARGVGLAEDELSEVKTALDGGCALDSIEVGALSPAERALTYALAMWLAQVDGLVDATELATLRDLGRRLELPEAKLQAAASAAFDIVCLPGGNRPDKFEFALLEARLREKLPALMSQRPVQA